MKKILAIVFAMLMLLSVGSLVIAEEAYDSEYIDLSGDWHFKVYRKYSAMFQYFAANQCEVTWEDNEAAILPGAETYSQWETVPCPAADYSTGGLLQMNRGEGMGIEDDRTQLAEFDLFPKWSEAWFCKTVEIPAGFLKEGETATLLLGVIDDNDVVYVNGTPIAASGFLTAAGEKAPAANVPETGGFVNDGDFRFEKSYWEISREYAIPEGLLREGANEIAIRLYNNNSYGGFYDRTMALVATRNCVNFLKDLPIEAIADNAAYDAVVQAQVAALKAEDIDAYAATLADDYYENELDKAEQVAKIAAIFEAYDGIDVQDENGGFYTYRDRPVYFASRTITGTKDGETAVISSEKEMIQYFADGGSGALEQGNKSFCYTVTYTSHIEAMGGKQLQYSIYLPPSYYDTDKSYPVVYLLHGINSTGDSFVNVDHIEARMNEWIAAGDVQDMIVVMPNSGKSSGYEDREAPNGIGDSAGPWASHIYVDMIQEIDTNYRTLAQREFRGISGISMGGGGVFKVGMTHTDLYTSFATHMGAGGNVADYLKVTPEELAELDFYLDCGLQDHMADPEGTRKAGEYLDSIGANVYWELRDGGHNSAFYMQGMPASMKMHSDHFLKNGLKEVWGE